MTLEWCRIPTTDEVSYVSACGSYSVGLDKKHNVWRSYRLAPGGPWFTEFNAPQITQEAAKAACEADRELGRTEPK